VNPGGAGSNALTFTMNAPGSLTILTASPLPSGVVGVTYSEGLTATGGATPYKGWAVAGAPTSEGTFTFALQVTDNANAVATEQFSLTIGGGTVSTNGIVNAASYAGGSVSPGEIVTIFGTFPGPASLVTLQLNSQGDVSTNLGGMEVSFDGFKLQ